MLNSITRSLVGGAAAVLFVAVLFGFRTWWSSINNATGGVDIGPILRPEYGVAGLMVFVIGFAIAWK